jgi:putative DNA primase/helicase
MVVAKVSGEDGGEKRILARAKSNIGPDDGGFEYRIDQAEPIPDISASFISWGKAVTGTATELLAEPEGRDGYSAPSAVQLAAEFLQLALASGKTPVKKITSEAKAARISWPSIKRASEKLGIIKTKGSDAWYWKLPNLLNQVANSVQPENLEHVEHVEHVAVAEPRAFTDFPRLEIQDDQEAQGAQLLSQGQVEHVGRRSSTSGTSATDFMEF